MSKTRIDDKLKRIEHQNDNLKRTEPRIITLSARFLSLIACVIFFQINMGLFHSFLTKIGLVTIKADRHPIRVFLLDDDERRHKWFTTRFEGDFIDIADNVAHAQQLLSAGSYDAIFLDHDLHPEHYHAESTDDERTGYAIAQWLGSNPNLQRASTILVHTRNADGAMRMVEELRRAGRAAEYVPFPMLAERIRKYWQR